MALITVKTMIWQLRHNNLPFSFNLSAVLGMDFSGTVKEIGEDITGFSSVDEVYD